MITKEIWQIFFNEKNSFYDKKYDVLLYETFDEKTYIKDLTKCLLLAITLTPMTLFVDILLIPFYVIFYITNKIISMSLEKGKIENLISKSTPVKMVNEKGEVILENKIRKKVKVNEIWKNIN